MSKLSSTSIEQNKEYIKQLKKQRTKQLRREIKILDDEKAFKANDVTSIKTDEEFQDESEEIYQIYLKMGILKPAEKTEGQKWLDEINNLLKEKIVNTATIDKMTKILYGGSYWDFKYKSFEGYRDVIQKGKIPTAEDTVIDSIVKSVMKDLSYLNLAPISPDSRLTEINKLFNRGLEIRSFLDRQKAILEKMTKSNWKKDQPLQYSGNPNSYFDFSEYSFESNTDIDTITISKKIKKDDLWVKPYSPTRSGDYTKEKRIKFKDIVLDKPTRVIVQAHKEEEEYKVNKNRVIEIEKNFLRSSFLEEVTQGKDFLTVEDIIKYATLSGREAIHGKDRLNPATFIESTTKSQNLDGWSKRNQLIVQKPESRNLIVSEVLPNTTLDKLIVDVSNENLSYLDDSDLEYINDKHRQLPKYEANIKGVVLDSVLPKKEIKADTKIDYRPDQNRNIDLGINLDQLGTSIDSITPKVDLSRMYSNNTAEYRPDKDRKIVIDRSLLHTKIGVDEILEKQEQTQNEEQKQLIKEYKKQIAKRHNRVRENIKNNIFDHRDPIQVSREKEVRSSHTNSKSSNSDSSDDGDGPHNSNTVDTDVSNEVEVKTEEISIDTNINIQEERPSKEKMNSTDAIEINQETINSADNNLTVDDNLGNAENIDNVPVESSEEFKWEDEDSSVTKEIEVDMSVNTIEDNLKEDLDDTNGVHESENSFLDRFGSTDSEPKESHIKEIDIDMLNRVNKRSNLMDNFEGIDINLDDFDFDNEPANFKDVGGKIMPDSFIEEQEIDLDTITEEELMKNYEKQRERERSANKDQIEATIINSNPVKMEEPVIEPKINKDLGKRRVKKEEVNIDDLLIDDVKSPDNKITKTIDSIEKAEPHHTDVTIDELIVNEGVDNKPIDVEEVGLSEKFKSNKLNPNNMTGSSEEKVQNILSKIFSEVDDELGDLPDLSKLVSTTTKDDENDYDSVDDILSSVGSYENVEYIDNRKDTLVEDIRTKSDTTDTVIIEDTRTNKESNTVTTKTEEDKSSSETLVESEIKPDKVKNTEESVIKSEEIDKETFKEDIINEIMGRLNSNGNESVKIKDALDTLTELLEEKKDIPEEYRERLKTFAEFLKKDNLLIQDYDSRDEIGESVKAPRLSYEKPEAELEPLSDIDLSNLDVSEDVSGELDKLISLDLEEINNNINTEVLEDNIISDLDSINKTTSMASQDTIDFVRIRQSLDNMLKNSWEIELGLRFNFVPSEKVVNKLNEYNLEVEQLGNGDCIVFYKKMDIKYLERRPSYHDFMTELKMAVANLLKTAMKQKVRLVNKNFIPRVTEEEIKIMQNHLTKLKLGIDGKDLVLDIKLDN